MFSWESWPPRTLTSFKLAPPPAMSTTKELGRSLANCLMPALQGNSKSPKESREKSWKSRIVGVIFRICSMLTWTDGSDFLFLPRNEGMGNKSNPDINIGLMSNS